MTEIEREKAKYAWNENELREEITRQVRKERLSKLLEGFQTTLYLVVNEMKLKPKCNKCDDYRLVHFKSPSGRDLTEICKCDKNEDFYVVKEAECSEFKICDFYGDKRQGKLIGWYTLRTDEDADYDYYTNANYGGYNNTYKNQSFEEINSPNMYFYTKDKAQEYADWLNYSIKYSEVKKKYLEK